MKKIIIKRGFRFLGTFYPESKEPVGVGADAAAFALKNGMAVEAEDERVADIDEARELAEVETKARAEAAANKNKGNAPENK